MTLAERVLYHQVHPLKLAADIGCTLVAVPLLWNGDLALGLIVAFGTPVVASAVVLATADLSLTRDSAVGAYLRRHMTPPVQALRLTMGVAIVWGAWVHSAIAIAVAVVVVALAWANGAILRRSSAA